MRVLTEVVEPLGMAGGPAMLLDGAGTASEKKKRKKEKKKMERKKDGAETAGARFIIWATTL
jgi:hypothetical protein